MGDVSIYGEDISNVSHSDEQQVLKDIRKSNVNKINIWSTKHKFIKEQL